MNLRANYPDHAAFIDSMRESFGADGINASIRAGMQGIPGKFCLRDLSGNIIAGTPSAPARAEISGADIVLGSSADLLAKGRAK